MWEARLGPIKIVTNQSLSEGHHMQRKPHSRDLRKGRHSEPGHIYHITTATLDRRTYFRDFYAARTLISALRTQQHQGAADTLAFVLMPDHLHWLMRLGHQRSLSGVVGTVKSVMAHQLDTRLWQEGFHDHALRRDQDLVQIARYIVANPLRAGLVDHLGDYPHWDAIWL